MNPLFEDQIAGGPPRAIRLPCTLRVQAGEDTLAVTIRAGTFCCDSKWFES